MNSFTRMFGVCVVVLAISAGAQPSEPPIYRAPLQPLTWSRRGVVFKATLAREFGRQCSRTSPQGQWTSIVPSKNEIKHLEMAIPAYMKGVKRRGWDGKFNDYYFQYGALVRGKRRFVYVNALPASDQDARQVWRRGPEVVCDGGPNFWGVEFDVKAGKFLNASFNGMA